MKQPRRTRRLQPREADDTPLFEDWELKRIGREAESHASNAKSTSPTPHDRRSWKDLTERDSCYRALRDVVTKPGGNTAGIDGIRPYDLSPSACGGAAALLSEKLRDGTYYPAKLLRKRIPKGDPAAGKFRELDIPTVVDRAADYLLAIVIREAIGHQFLAMSPSDKDTLISDVGLFDDGPQTFLEATRGIEESGLTLDAYAVRGQGTREFLADMGAAIDDGRTFVGNHDVRDAYPSMPIEPCLDALEQMNAYEHPSLQNAEHDAARVAVRAILTNGGRRAKGLPQGLTLSEVALDARLHFDHDLPVRDILNGESLEGGTS